MKYRFDSLFEKFFLFSCDSYTKSFSIFDLSYILNTRYSCCMCDVVLLSTLYDNMVSYVLFMYTFFTLIRGIDVFNIEGILLYSKIGYNTIY